MENTSITPETETETKVRKRTIAVLDRDFTYEFYGVKTTCHKGQAYVVGGRGAYPLVKEGIVITLGHGYDVVIPRTHFHLEEETTETTTITKTTTRVL